MSTFAHLPALPAAPIDAPFVQSVELREGKTRIGLATWHAPGGGSGVMQLLDLQIDPKHRRQGHGKRLMREVMSQCQRHLTIRGVRPRRLWIAVEQKTQVIGRAFLTELGFHHVSTIKELPGDQDLLVYLLSFD